MVAGLNRSVAHSITALKLGDRCKNIFGSALMGFDNRSGNDPVIAQLRDQLSQDGAVTTTGTTTPGVVVQKVLNLLFVEVCCREVLSLEPGAEGSEHAHRILRR